MKEKKENKILPLWVYVIVVIIIIITLMYELMLPPVAEINLTFKVIAAIFAIIAIFLTVKRMEQTQEQIEVISDNYKLTQEQIEMISNNYKLNNFFKHRTEFIIFFSGNENFKSIAGGEVKHLENMLMDYYEYFFTKSYSKFTATFNDDALLDCNHFISNISKTKLIQHEINLFDLKKEEVFKATLPPAFPRFYISEYLSLFLNQKDYRFKDYNGVNSAEQKEIYFHILKVYFIYIIITEISSFSGEMETIKFPENFYINIMMYLEKLGIDDGLIRP